MSKHALSHSSLKTVLLALLFFWVLTQCLIVQASESKLDQKIQAGFSALQAKNWKQAQSSFEEAVKIFEGKPTASQLILTKLSLAPSDTVVTVNGKPQDVSAEINSFRQMMSTRQALYEFVAFSARLSGDNQSAEKYLTELDEMRGVMWGRSWVELIPQIHKLFFSYLSSDSSEPFSRYLLTAGQLLLNVEDPGGIKLLEEAKQNLPKEFQIPALLASYMITHGDPANAKREAQASLALNPNQPSVLIDLATAEWMTGELDDAANAARKAMGLNAKLPGPHATLAFVALEKGDTSSALKEAELGNKLSNGHRFFKTILAISFEASGDTQRAKSLIAEAWEGGSPDEDVLKGWFFRGKPLEYARRFIKQ